MLLNEQSQHHTTLMFEEERLTQSLSVTFINLYTSVGHVPVQFQCSDLKVKAKCAPAAAPEPVRAELQAFPVPPVYLRSIPAGVYMWMNFVLQLQTPLSSPV